MKPFVVALTGSIGMGKSTTASIFRELGVPVWSADESVHRLYEQSKEAIAAIGEICPEAVSKDGVDRNRLAQWIEERPRRLKKLERVIHPLVAADRKAFVSDTQSSIVVLDIPLLFETGSENVADAILVVSTAPEEQRKRVLSRPNMTEDRFEILLAKQLPDAQKRARADFVIQTDTIDSARSQVVDILKEIRERLPGA